MITILRVGLLLTVIGQAVISQSAQALPAETAESITDLRRALGKINADIDGHPIAGQAGPLSEEQARESIKQHVRSHQSLDPEMKQTLLQIAETGVLPESAKLRHFLRYDLLDGMQHGSWVRLIVERPNSGPTAVTFRDHPIFQRPHTQAERVFRASVKKNGGMPTLGRLTTWFQDDPNFGISPKIHADYDTLLTSVRRAIKAKDADSFRKLYDFHDVAKNAPLRKFITAEIASIISRDIKSIDFVPQRFIGQPYQWQSFYAYGPNHPVEGYVRITFMDAPLTDPESLFLEVGAVDNRPVFICHVTQEDQTATRFGKKLSGSITTSGYTLVLAGNAYESVTNIESPFELPELRRANDELWRRGPRVQNASAPLPGDVTTEVAKNDAGEGKGIVWSTQPRNGWLAGGRVLDAANGLKPGQPLVIQYYLKNISPKKRDVKLCAFHNSQFTSLNAGKQIYTSFSSDTNKIKQFTLDAEQVLVNEEFQLTVDTTGLASGDYTFSVSSAFSVPSETTKNRFDGMPMRGLLAFTVTGDPPEKHLKKAPVAKDARHRIYWSQPNTGLQVGARYRDGRQTFRVGQEPEADLFLFNGNDEPIAVNCAVPHPSDGWLLNIDNQDDHTIMPETRIMISIFSTPSYIQMTLDPGEIVQLTNAQRLMSSSRIPVPIENCSPSVKGGAKFQIGKNKEDGTFSYDRIRRFNLAPGQFTTRISVSLFRADIPGMRLSLHTAPVPFTVVGE